VADDRRHNQAERRAVTRGGRRENDPIFDLGTERRPMFTVQHVCDYYIVERRQVMKWIHAGTLRARCICGNWRIRREDLLAFDAAQVYRGDAELPPSRQAV
jgi:excisionase family DNA binding protein